MILDVDGTLVDTNYHHTIAWRRAFVRHGADPALWRIHRHIGMGGDQLVAALCGDEVERERGDAIRASEAEAYAELIGEVGVIAGARELIEDLKRRERTVVLASSAKSEEVDSYLDLLGARDLADAWTTAADVEATKPEPDLVGAALRLAGGGPAVMVGDTTWDVVAAARAGVPAIAVLTGGFGFDELHGAGAVAVHESVATLREQIDRPPLSG